MCVTCNTKHFSRGCKGNLQRNADRLLARAAALRIASNSTLPVCL